MTAETSSDPLPSHARRARFASTVLRTVPDGATGLGVSHRGDQRLGRNRISAPRERGQSKDEIVEELFSHATEMVDLDLVMMDREFDSEGVKEIFAPPAAGPTHNQTALACKIEMM